MCIKGESIDYTLIIAEFVVREIGSFTDLDGTIFCLQLSYATFVMLLENVHIQLVTLTF